MTDTIEDKVRDRAFAIWVEEGRPEGRAEEHWFKAEAELAAAKPGPARKKAAVVATGKAPAKAGEKKAASPRKVPAAKKAAIVAAGGRGKNVKI